jgi:hypothetical protein
MKIDISDAEDRRHRRRPGNLAIKLWICLPWPNFDVRKGPWFPQLVGMDLDRKAPRCGCGEA